MEYSRIKVRRDFAGILGSQRDIAKKHIDGFGRNFLGGEPDDSWVKKVTVRDQGRRQGV